MIKRITSVSELPDWFKNRIYKKRLSKVDWFREICARARLMHLLEMRQREADYYEEEDLDWSRKALLESREILLKLLKNTPHPNSLLFYVSQSNRPVHDLTAGEALYFRSAIRDDDLIQLGKRFDGLLSLWLAALKEDPEGPTPLFGEYEHQIQIFFTDLDKSPWAGKLDEPVEKFLDGVGNPWLSWGRPLNGFPITIDTQYDDETIINYFKSWLAEKRKTEGKRVRRPFLQNDFDDWEYLRIPGDRDRDFRAIVTADSGRS